MPSQKPRSHTDWQQQLRNDLEFACHCLREAGEVKPMYIVHTANEAMIIDPDFSDLAHKRRSQQLVSTVCLAYDAEALSFITEGWTRSIPDHLTEAEWNAQPPPSDAPDRIEVIMAHLSFRDWKDRRRNLSLMRTIDRDELGEIIGLTPFPDDTIFDNMTGAMADTLPPSLAPLQLRDVALATLKKAGFVATPFQAPTIH